MLLYITKINKNKITRPNKVKGELYSLPEESEICTSHLQNTLQDIVDKEIKITSWEKSENTGGQIEDNLFVLQYCIEKSYRMKKELIVTCIDYSKAFDSIKRDKIIEALMQYRIQPKIIDTIAKIYQDDFTEIQICELRKTINITSGIRQGCTGSTMLFKLITYM